MMQEARARGEAMARAMANRGPMNGRGPAGPGAPAGTATAAPVALGAMPEYDRQLPYKLTIWNYKPNESGTQVADLRLKWDMLQRLIDATGASLPAVVQDADLLSSVDIGPAAAPALVKQDAAGAQEVITALGNLLAPASAEPEQTATPGMPPTGRRPAASTPTASADARRAAVEALRRIGGAEAADALYTGLVGRQASQQQTPGMPPQAMIPAGVPAYARQAMRAAMGGGADAVSVYIDPGPRLHGRGPHAAQRPERQRPAVLRLGRGLRAGGRSQRHGLSAGRQRSGDHAGQPGARGHHRAAPPGRRRGHGQGRHARERAAMTIQQTISEQMKEALRSGEKERLRVLRLLKTELQVAERSGQEFDEVAVLRSYANSLRKAADEYEARGRPEMADAIRQDVRTVEEFLPRQMPAADLEALIASLIEREGFGPGDVGKVMRSLMAEHAGQVDGRLAQQIARRLLEG